MSCDEKEGQCGCNEKKCGSDEKKCSTGCEMTDMMMHIADEAWAELMKEKMKKLWEEKRGETMDKAAEAGVNASMDYWMHKMEAKAKCHEHKENVKNAFTG